MGKKRTVLKVSIIDNKCQKEILSAVAKIPGIQKMEIDTNKGTLTVIGEVEPVPIFKALKKIGKNPEIVTVGPPKPERWGWGPYTYTYTDQQNKEDLPPGNLNRPCYCYNSGCKQCELVYVPYDHPYESNTGQCTIL